MIRLANGAIITLCLLIYGFVPETLANNPSESMLDIGFNEINIKNLYNLEGVPSPIIDKELNSWFHFKLQKELVPDLIYPGIISEFKENDWKRMYSIHDDPNVLSFISKQAGENLIIESIVLLLSRPCDIAQNKYGKNLKLLSGLKIVNPIRKNNQRQDFQKGSSNIDSIKVFDHLYFSEEESDVTLLFDFRYNFSVPEVIFKSEFDNLKIFNKELLSEMQVEYSSYSSRLGITQVI